jgi:hypothetical protein
VDVLDSVNSSLILENLGHHKTPRSWMNSAPTQQIGRKAASCRWARREALHRDALRLENAAAETLQVCRTAL